MSSKVSRPVLRGPGPSNVVRLLGVKADVAALLTFLVLCGFRHISAENLALGSLRSDDWQLARPTAPPLWSVFRVLALIFRLLSKRSIPVNIIIISGFHRVLTLIFEAHL
jgi:hypothetical protein